MLPLRPRAPEYARPARRAAPKFNLPYPPTKKPIPLHRDEFYDPYQYFPTRRVSQKLATRPSKTPPRSTQYEIVDRIPGPDGLPTYVVREATHNQTVRDCSAAEGAARTQEAGSEGNERTVAETVLDPIDYIRKGLLNRNSVSSALGRHDRSSTPQSPASRPREERVDNDTGTFQVPFTQIRSYVSPLQLERFENFRFRNPNPDDLPYKVSAPPALVSERESQAMMEREIKPVELLSSKRRKLDKPMKAVPHNMNTRVSGIGAFAGTSSKAPDQGDDDDKTGVVMDDDDKTGVVMDDDGADELSKGLPTISPDQPRYGSRTVRESTTTSSTSDILHPHVAPSQIALNDSEEYLAQRSLRCSSAPATSSAASSFEEKQDPPNPFSTAIKHRRLGGKKKKPLTTHRHKRQPHTPQTPQEDEAPPCSSDQAYEVSRILTHDYVDNVRYYQVSWTGFPETEENLTWLTEEELQGAPQVLKRYLKYLDTGIDGTDDEGNEMGEQDAITIRKVLAEEGIV